jgi:hypothetical protein
MLGWASAAGWVALGLAGWPSQVFTFFLYVVYLFFEKN